MPTKITIQLSFFSHYTDKGQEEIIQLRRFAPDVKISALVPDRHLTLAVRTWSRSPSAKGTRLTNSSRKEVVLFSHKEKYEIVFTIKKKFMSPTHKESFHKSLEWPENDGTIMLQKSCGATSKEESFYDVKAALSRDGGDVVRYLCFICKEYHELDLVAGTSVLEL